MAVYDPYSEQLVGLREQRALAQKLREQANQQSQGQMVSGWYVPSSPFDALASGLMNYKATQREREAEQGIKQLGEQRRAQNEAWLQGAPTEQTYQVEDRSALPEAQQTQMGPSPYSKALRVKPTTEETLAWAMKAPGLDTGAVAQLGVKSAELEAGRQARLGERQLILEAEAKRERERAEDKREAQERDQRARQDAQERELRARQENIRLTASLRPPREEKPLTEFQGKSTMFGTRAAQSHNILNQYEQSANPLAVAASGFGGKLINWALPEEAIKVEQAQRNFINAVLRQESGAAIGSTEFDSAKRQYFPQPGDTPEVIAQKRANRDLVIKGFARQAGAGASDIAEIYNAPPALPVAPATPAPAASAAPALPSQNAIAAEIARRQAAATNQGRPR